MLRGILSISWKPLALCAGLALTDALWEPTRLRVAQVDLPVDERTNLLVGVRLAQLSDLHVRGRGWRRGTLARAIELCNREVVDLVAITGDMIGSVAGAADAVELLGRLRADVPRIAVLGNHDHVHGGRPLQQLIEGLDSLGIVVLRNRAVFVETPSCEFWVAGVDDGYSMRDDLGQVRRALPPDDFPRLFLTHYPDVADQLRPGEFQLSLAGHSHGGQIRFPVLASLASNLHARTKYVSGLYRVNGNPLYVSPGLGVSGVPLRFRNWPVLSFLRFVLPGRTGWTG
jgi:predicted MPP superfamily phosphohydrolase